MSLKEYVENAALITQCIGCGRIKYNGHWEHYIGGLPWNKINNITGGACPDCFNGYIEKKNNISKKEGVIR